MIAPSNRDWVWKALLWINGQSSLNQTPMRVRIDDDELLPPIQNASKSFTSDWPEIKFNFDPYQT